MSRLRSELVTSGLHLPQPFRLAQPPSLHNLFLPQPSRIRPNIWRGRWERELIENERYRPGWELLGGEYWVPGGGVRPSREGMERGVCLWYNVAQVGFDFFAHGDAEIGSAVLEGEKAFL